MIGWRGFDRLASGVPEKMSLTGGLVPNDPSDGVRLVRIDELRRCLAIAFERLGLAPADAEGLHELPHDTGVPGT
jgi:hypothetical protein